MVLLFTVLCLLVMQASPIPQANNSAEFKSNLLYYNVILNRFNAAVRMTVELKNNGDRDVIRLVVNRLLAEGHRNLVNYAYKLIGSGKSDIVNYYFPLPLRRMLTGEEIVFINRRDEMALKVEWSTDRDGDRGVYGDSNEWEQRRMAWKVIPHWYNTGELCFEILNVGFNQYLKLETATDGDGEHKAFAGNEHDTRRHLWYFYPVQVDRETLFFIINWQYGHALKLGRYVDGANDRRAWGEKGGVLGNPGYFAWYVRPHNTYVK